MPACTRARFRISPLNSASSWGFLSSSILGSRQYKMHQSVDTATDADASPSKWRGSRAQSWHAACSRRLRIHHCCDLSWNIDIQTERLPAERN